MLATFRAMAKSKITLVVLFIPLTLGLLVFGNVSDVFSGMNAKDAVVIAGDRTVSSAEFKTRFDNAKKDYEQRAGAPIMLDEIVAQGGVTDILESLANREGFFAALTKAGVRPSDTLVAEALRKIPAFFDPVTGRFDAALYRQKLAENGLTPEVFERSEKDNVAQSHFTSAIEGGLQAPAVFPALVAALALEQRTFSVFALDPRRAPVPAAPTDAQLTAFIKAHADQMMSPEQRSLVVVRFSARAMEPLIQIDPAELQKRFDFRKDTLSAPEKRTVVQIPAKTAEAAAAAAARLAKGEDPAAVAKTLGVEPILYRDVPRTAIADPRIAQAAFGMASGQQSGAVQGGLGWAALKILAVTPGRTVTLAEARPSLEAELRAEAAQDRIYDVVEKYQATHEGGASLAESARAAGVTALELPPVTAQGADSQGRPGPLLTPKLLKEAFALPEGGESEVVDDGKGEYFAVRVEKIFPAALPSLSDQRGRITAYYMSTEQARIYREKVEAIAEGVRNGQTMDAAAAQLGAKVDRVTLDRRSAEQERTERRQVFQAVFSGKPNTVFTLGAWVIKIEAIRPGSVQEAALFTRAGGRQMTRTAYQDLAEQAYRWTRREMKVKTDLNLARKSLGLAPVEEGAVKDSADKAPAKPAAK